MRAAHHKILTQIKTEFLHFLFPPSCSICNQPSTDFLCQECFQKLQESKYPHHQFISRFGDRVYCATRYSQQTSSLITSLKYKKNYPAAKWIATFLLPLLESVIPYSHLQDTILVPVPISMQKKLSRGYNQCEMIAQSLSSMTGISCDTKSLQRRSFIFDKDQIGLSRKQRESNPTCQFTWVGKQIYSSIVLVDDICTTGKTLFECRSAIQEQNPECEVVSIVFAHPEG
jgi:competence protein ComFC